MAYHSISVEPLTPHVGAEIGNIDLTKPLSNLEVEELHRAFLEFGVIFFRDQPIDFDSHIALARHFGDLHLHIGPSTESRPLEENPAIRILHFDEASEKVAGEMWHSDQSCALIPPLDCPRRRSNVRAIEIGSGKQVRIELVCRARKQRGPLRYFHRRSRSHPNTTIITADRN